MAPSRRQQVALLVYAVVAWLAGWLILGFRIELLYDTSASYFLWTWSFLRPWLDRPGGVLLYAGAFLHQFYHWTWLGALVGAAVTGLCGWALAGARRRLRRGEDLFHVLAPAVLLLSLHALGTVTLGYAAAIACLAAYAALPAGRARGPFGAAAAGALYVAVGVHVWWFVAWVAGAAAADRRGDWRPRAAWAAAAAGVAIAMPLVAHRLLFSVPLRAAFTAPWRWPDSLLERASLVYLAAAPLCPPLAAVGALQRRVPADWRWRAEAGLAAALALLLVARAFDADRRRLGAYQRLHRAQDWAGIVARAERETSTAALGAAPENVHQAVQQFIVDHALARQGRLLESLFGLPQPWGTRGLVLNLPTAGDDARWALYTSELWLELGHINAAYRWAYNQSTVSGPTYGNAYQVGVCALAGGNEAIAAKHAALLGRTLFHRREAAELRRLVADPEAAAARYGRSRALRPTVEIDVALGEVGALLALVESEPDNRLALDYLVAWCLLDKEALPLAMDQLARHLGRHSRRLPRHCQEALLLWAGDEAEATFARIESRCDPPVRQQYDAFLRLAAGPAVGAATAPPVPAELARTYWWYYAFRPALTAGVPAYSWERLGAEFALAGALRLAQLLTAQAAVRAPAPGPAPAPGLPQVRAAGGGGPVMPEAGR